MNKIDGFWCFLVVCAVGFCRFCHFRIFIRIHYETSPDKMCTQQMVLPFCLKLRRLPLLLWNAMHGSVVFSFNVLRCCRCRCSFIPPFHRVYEFSFITYTHVKTVSTWLCLTWNRNVCAAQNSDMRDSSSSSSDSTTKKLCVCARCGERMAWQQNRERY